MSRSPRPLFGGRGERNARLRRFIKRDTPFKKPEIKDSSPPSPRQSWLIPEKSRENVIRLSNRPVVAIHIRGVSLRSTNEDQQQCSSARRASVDEFELGLFDRGDMLPHVSDSGDEPSDAVDIAASLAGDAAAYGRLVGRYQSRVGQFLWRFTRDRGVCEELAQTVFVEAFLSLGTFEGRSPFWSWLKVIATRTGYRHWRTQGQRRLRGDVSLEVAGVVTGAGPDASEQAVRKEEVARLVGMLDQLPPRDRLVLTLMYLEENSVAEIAVLTGWSQTLVKVQAFRARNKLKKLMGVK